MKHIKIFIMLLGMIAVTSCKKDDVIDTKPFAAFKVNEALVNIGTPVSFTDLSFDQNGTVISWHWDFGNNETSTEQNPVYTYPVTGEYQVTLTVTDNAGYQNANTFTKTVSVVVPSTATINPDVIWSYDVPYISSHNSVSVSDNGTVYFGSDGKSTDLSRGDYNIFAVKNGSLSWGYLTDEVVRSSTVIADDGTVYAGDYNGELVAMNANGTLKWRVDLGKRIRYSSPAIGSDGTLYIGMEDDNTLLSINPTDGSVNWSFSVGGDIRATPTIDSKGNIYIASSDGNLYAVNPDGTEKWKTAYGSYTAAPCALNEAINTVYFSGKTSNDTGHLIAFDMNTGAIKWDNGNRLLAKTEQGGPVVAKDGTIYLGGEDKKMVAYNPDGTEKWTFETSNRVLAAPALDNNGNLYFGDVSGAFYVLNPDGEIKWKTSQLNEEINSSAAIGKDGTIYILTRDNTNKKGKLFALRTDATGLLDSPWPMFSKNARHTGR